MFSLHSLGLHAPHLGGLRDGLDGVGVQLAPAVARAAHYEDGGLVEHPVERAQQRVVAREELVCDNLYSTRHSLQEGGLAGVGGRE